MVLDPGLLIELLIGLASLLSGAMAAAVSFLLYRQKGDPIFRDFGGMVAGLGWYGVCDQILTVVAKVPGTNQPDVAVLAVAEVVGLCLAAGFALLFLVRLGGQIPPKWLRWGAWIPASLAVVAGSVVLATGGVPDRTLGMSFLALVLLWLTGGLGFALIRRRVIHDREVRRLVLATTALVLFFLPFWALQMSGVLSLPTFALFYLVLECRWPDRCLAGLVPPRIDS